MILWVESLPARVGDNPWKSTTSWKGEVCENQAMCWMEDELGGLEHDR